MKDAWGIRWTLATRVKEVSAEEIERASQQWMRDHPSELDQHGSGAVKAE